MWHHRGWFGGGWVFWVFMFLIFSGFFGKAGWPGFVVPLILFWVIMPMIFGAKKDYRHDRPIETRPHRSEPVIQGAGGPRRESPEPVRPAPTTVRSLSSLPPHCKSCGGPVDETTILWKGSYPACGFCGTGLQNQD